MTERYRSASALRRALETRLNQEATDTSTDLTRRRRLVVFDRVAARLSADPASGWILKGGAALEFRLRSKARATKDMDLAARRGGARRAGRYLPGPARQSGPQVTANGYFHCGVVNERAVRRAGRWADQGSIDRRDREQPRPRTWTTSAV